MNPLSQIRQIDYTVIFVRDMEAMRQFYGTVMEFPLQRTLSDKWIEYRIGANTLRFGICHPLGSVTRPDTDDGIIESVFGRPVDKEREGTWGSAERSA